MRLYKFNAGRQRWANNHDEKGPAVRQRGRPCLFDITQILPNQLGPILAGTWGRERDPCLIQKLRDRAARVFAMALKSWEKGSEKHANELTQLANEMLQHAEEMERHSALAHGAQASQA